MLDIILIVICFMVCASLLNLTFFSGLTVYFIMVIVSWWLREGFVLGSFLGFAVSYSDIVFLASCLLFFRNLRDASPKNRIWKILLLAFSIEILFSVMRGTFTFGIQAAVNEARPVLYGLGVLYWYKTASYRFKPDREVLVRFASLGIAAILAIEYLNIAIYGLGSASTFLQVSEYESLNLRPLVAIQAISLLGFSSILTVEAIVSSKRRATNVVLASLGLIGILLSQQRSVWVATIATILAFMFWRKSARVGIFLISSIIMFSYVIPILRIPFISQSVREQLQDSMTNLTTYFARSGSWEQYLGSFQSWDLIDQLIGKPFGLGWGRYDGYNNLWVEFNPHNWYIIVLLRLGIIGLATISIFYLTILLKNYRRGDDGFGICLVLLQQLVFQNFYPMPWQAIQGTLVNDSKTQNDQPKQTLQRQIDPKRKSHYGKNSSVS